jgi:trans-aconitate methyltransferase
MATIDTKAQYYWNIRYQENGNSGYGSYDKQLTKKLDWLTGLPIESIAEIGCGDFHFGSELLKRYPKASYIGQDISEVIIEKDQKQFPNVQFVEDLDELPSADLVLCIDVLFHILDEVEYKNVLAALKLRWKKYLAITAYEYTSDLHTHVRHRKFDYQAFGEPVIRGVVEENGNLMFYLFKKDD